MRLPAMLALLACAGACADPAAPPAPIDPVVLTLSPPPATPPPDPGNEVAEDPAAAALGHRLFFDPGPSAGGAVACATCHRPERFFTDGLRFARGEGRGVRNTPSILAAPHLPFLYADGRKDSLWSQALAPLEEPTEHGLDRVGVLRAVATGHRDAWERVFGPLPSLAGLPPRARPVPGDPDHPDARAWASIPADRRAELDRTFVRVGKALAAYQRRLRFPETPFDRHVAALRAGDPTGGGHLSPAARRGLRTFVGPGRCVACHGGPLLGGGAFHNLGLPPSGEAPELLEGRARGARLLLADPFRCEGCDELRFLDPALPAFAGAFRAPSLRGVADTAPYMHAGQFLTLEEVVDFYRFRPGRAAVGTRDGLLARIDPALSTHDLVAFLRSLSGPVPEDPWWRPPPTGP